ncbi:hypothetical protein SLS63_010318 [Diaporthe eres]|uniref:Uncharacterized protein n=1 Tax=Diaporthe eres TaxID=83184 RepID=A0ABR1NX90_DIAER
MVATRSSGRGSQADTPQKHVTLSGEVNKPKKATKAKKKPGAAPMKAGDLMFEAELMKQVGLGEGLFSKRLDPPWKQYTGPCLMGLPAHVRNKIINSILPIDQQPEDQQDNSVTRPSDSEHYQGLVFHCTYIHPILWTCRQIRYEYGQLFLTNNHFMWLVPRDWDSTQITRFTQHAASVGVPNYALFMDLSTRVDGPGYKCYPHQPLAEGCRDNLDRWMKTVYYGVETRVLVNEYPLRRDDGMLAHFLHQAQQQGKSWDQLLESLKEAWEAYMERRDLAVVNLGKGVSEMTALYKASNERLEKVRALSLGTGEVS